MLAEYMEIQEAYDSKDKNDSSVSSAENLEQNILKNKEIDKRFDDLLNEFF